MLFEKTKQHADIMFWVNSYKYFPCGKVKKYKATISTRLWPDNAASPDSDESNRSNVRASGHSVRYCVPYFWDIVFFLGTYWESTRASFFFLAHSNSLAYRSQCSHAHGYYKQPYCSDPFLIANHMSRSKKY